MDAEELLVKHDSLMSGMTVEELQAHTTALRDELEEALSLIDRMTGSQHFYSLLKAESRKRVLDIAAMHRHLYSKERQLDAYKTASDFIIEVVERVSSLKETPSGPRADALASLVDEMQDHLRAGLRYFKKNLPEPTPTPSLSDLELL